MKSTSTVVEYMSLVTFPPLFIEVVFVSRSHRDCSWLPAVCQHLATGQETASEQTHTFFSFCSVCVWVSFLRFLGLKLLLLEFCCQKIYIFSERSSRFTAARLGSRNRKLQCSAHTPHTEMKLSMSTGCVFLSAVVTALLITASSPGTITPTCRGRGGGWGWGRRSGCPVTLRGSPSPCSCSARRESPAHFNLRVTESSCSVPSWSSFHLYLCPPPPQVSPHGGLLQVLPDSKERGDCPLGALVHHLSHRHCGVGDVSRPEALRPVSRRAAGPDREAGGEQGGVGQAQGGTGGEGVGGEGEGGPAENWDPASAWTPQCHQRLAGGVPAGECEFRRLSPWFSSVTVDLAHDSLSLESEHNSDRDY